MCLENLRDTERRKMRLYEGRSEQGGSHVTDLMITLYGFIMSSAHPFFFYCLCMKEGRTPPISCRVSVFSLPPEKLFGGWVSTPVHPMCLICTIDFELDYFLILTTHLLASTWRVRHPLDFKNTPCTIICDDGISIFPHPTHLEGVCILAKQGATPLISCRVWSLSICDLRYSNTLLPAASCGKGRVTSPILRRVSWLPTHDLWWRYMGWLRWVGKENIIGLFCRT